MKTISKTALLAVIASACFVGAASAMPSWIGAYGNFERHSAGNPGKFTILMNQDYVGLHAEVGVQVNGGSWSVSQMAYVGNDGGNSKWELVPAQSYPAGATVKFYFHGYDNWGGNIWDSLNGANYSFMADAASGLQFAGAVNLGLSGPGGSMSDSTIFGNKAYALAGGQINVGTIVSTGVVWGTWHLAAGRNIAANSNTVVVVGNDAGNLVIARSTDGGNTFGAPVTVNVTTGTIQSLDIGSRGSEFAIVYAVSPDAAYYNAHDLFSIKSSNNGLNWGAPAVVDAMPMGWFDGITVEANATRFFAVYRYVEQVYAASIRAAHSADAQAWTASHLFGDKAASTYGSVVVSDGAYVVLDPYYDNITRLARYNGSAWEISTISHPEGYSSGRAVKIATTGNDLFFFRSQAYPATGWDIRKSNDQGFNWTPAGSIATPAAVPSNPPFLQSTLSGNGRVHLVWVNGDWRYGANVWQVSLKSVGGPVNWVGNTAHVPGNSQLASTNNLWVNTESWPAGNAVGAGVVYSTDGSNWTWATMSANGRVGNNDKWTINLGQFLSGTTIRYAVYAEDGNGVQKWDNNGGQDFRAIVQSNPNIHAPFFYNIDPYRGDTEKVRANGRTKDASFNFGAFTPLQSITILTRPIESGNGESVQFGPVEMVSYFVYANNPEFANAQTVYGDFHSAAFSNKPIFDNTTFNLGSFPTGSTIYFWIGSGNSSGAGYAQSFGEVYRFNVQ